MLQWTIVVQQTAESKFQRLTSKGIRGKVAYIQQEARYQTLSFIFSNREIAILYHIIENQRCHSILCSKMIETYCRKESTGEEGGKAEGERRRTVTRRHLLRVIVQDQHIVRKWVVVYALSSPGHWPVERTNERTNERHRERREGNRKLRNACNNNFYRDKKRGKTKARLFIRCSSCRTSFASSSRRLHIFVPSLVFTFCCFGFLHAQRFLSLSPSYTHIYTHTARHPILWPVCNI